MRNPTLVLVSVGFLAATVAGLSGCKSKTTPAGGDSPPELARPTAPPPPEPNDCFDECMQASMMEARSAESIEMDCKASCGTGDPTPVTTGAELAMLTGKRITATGTLVRAEYPTKGTEGAAIALASGPKLWVDDDGVPEGWESMVDTTITVVGTLTQGPTASGQRIKIPFLDQPEAPKAAE